MKGNVVAVVVTYNRKILLKECLDSLLKQTYENLDICIIDNCSSDGTFKLIQPMLQSERIIYKRTKKNMGGAGGFNCGIKFVASKNYDYIWIMDDDTIPRPDALEKLMQGGAIIGGPFGFMASCVVWDDGSFCKMNNPGIKKDMLYDYEYQHAKEGVFNIHHASFVSILLPTAVVKEVGLPIKEFFIWKDDYEYTSRISQKYKCYYIAKSEVIHKMKSNMLPDIVYDGYERIDRYKYEYRNEYYLVRHKGLMAKCHYYYNAIGTMVRILRESADHKLKRLGAMISGIVQGWGFKPDIEYILDMDNKNNEKNEFEC